MTLDDEPGSDRPEPHPPESLRTRIGWMPLLLGVAGLAVIAMVVFAMHAGTASGSSAASPTISNQMATVLEVNPLMTLGTPAPAFSLTDQNGKTETLSSFAGRSVVLTFGDDKCTDLCTLLAEDILAADKDLGSHESHVQFVSINANPYYPSASATKSWTDSHGLGHTANWHFLTSTPAVLKSVANKYGVEVDLHAKSRTIDHGTEVFFISPAGNEEQIGDFGTESANTAEFAHSMAQLATEMLPEDAQATVNGPTSAAPASTDTAIGSTPPPIELPALGTRIPASTAAYRGKYLAINFWSPTCSICVHELPAIQRAASSVGSSAAVIGVDVSDPGAAGKAFAAKLGASYPMLFDTHGSVAAQYEIPGLPYTVIVDPRGKVVVRHPGEMTSEQLEYILGTLMTEAPHGN